jgi:hypothetical protein
MFLPIMNELIYDNLHNFPPDIPTFLKKFPTIPNAADAVEIWTLRLQLSSLDGK